MDREGHAHDGINIAWRGEDVLTVDVHQLAGKQLMAYGQTKIQEDLYEVGEAAGLAVVFEADDVQPQDVTSAKPSVTYTHHGEPQRIDCEFVVGCDGFHGVSRSTIPDDVRVEYEKEYPFGWLGILSETPLTLEDMGAKYGITKERTRQVEARIIKRLRDFIKKDVKDFDRLRM